LAERAVPAAERAEALQEKYDELGHAAVVITDRLHGMILCAITGTPCIVLDSRSPKVRGCYEWVEDLDYIRFVENPSQIITAYQSIPKKEHIYPAAHMEMYFQELEKDLVRYILGGSDK
jgi:pyruvyl transferase EpsI